MAELKGRFLNDEHPDVRGNLSDKQNELEQYMIGLGCNVSEAQIAYQHALGIPIDEEVREEVYQLAQKMDDLMKCGLPVNRIVQMIKKQERDESTMESLHNNFLDLITKLDISIKERAVLQSIVATQKEGKLVISDHKSGTELFTRILRRDENMSDSMYKKIILLNMVDMLGQSQDRKIEIAFSDFNI